MPIRESVECCGGAAVVEAVRSDFALAASDNSCTAGNAPPKPKDVAPERSKGPAAATGPTNVAVEAVPDLPKSATAPREAPAADALMVPAQAQLDGACFSGALQRSDGSRSAGIWECGEREGLLDAVNSAYDDIIANQSIKKRGPVVSGVQDLLTGEVAVAQNSKTIPDNLHPELAGRLSAIEEGAPYKGVPGSHGEIYALNQLLWKRQEAGMSTVIDDSFIFFSDGFEASARGSRFFVAETASG